MTAVNVHNLYYLISEGCVGGDTTTVMMLGDKGYFSMEIQQNLFDAANIIMERSIA